MTKPPKGFPPSKKVHFLRDPNYKRLSCGRARGGARETLDKNEATCKKCLKSY